MTISKIVHTAFRSSTIDDSVPIVVDTDEKQVITKNKEYGSYDGYTHIRTGESLVVPSYDGNIDDSYAVGDLVHTEPDRTGLFQQCKAEASAPRLTQPDNYCTPTINYDMTTMNEVYSLLYYTGLIIRGQHTFTMTNGDVTYMLYKNRNSPTGWLWTTRWRVGGNLVAHTIEAKVVNYDTIDANGAKAYSIGAGGDEYWAGKYFILGDIQLWMRTDKDIEPQAEAGGVAQWANVIFLDETPHFSRYKNTDRLSPLDTKNYSSITSDKDLEKYSVIAPDADFDSVAISGVSCETIDVTFYTQAGAVVTTILNYIIDVSVDTAGLIQEGRTTVVLYATSLIEAGGYVEITFNNSTHTAELEIGEIYLGRKIDAGLTNVSFSNSVQDWSPKEQDQWGNIDRVNGNVRSDIYTGSVDVDMDDYDSTNRLFRMLGGQKLIVDGSDTTSNTKPDGATNFASTKVVGRLNDVSLSTIVENNEFGKKAIYNFTIEGDV